MQADLNALYRTPVLLIKGVNHGHFASGDMPPTVRQNDLSADVAEATAHALIASYVNDFLLLHVPEQRSLDVTETKIRIEEAYNDTGTLYQVGLVTAYFLTTTKKDNNTVFAVPLQ